MAAGNERRKAGGGIMAGMSFGLGMGLSSGRRAPAPAGPTYGPELVANGDFSSTAGWTTDGWAIQTGSRRALTNANGGTLRRTAAATLVAGTYLVAFDTDSNDGTTLRPLVGGSAAPDQAGTGAYSQEVTVAAVTDQLVGMQDVGASDAVIRNYSVKQRLT
jgi:hypothetical protein